MNKDSLLNKFGTIKSDLKNILLSDQELLQLLGSWEDDPLNDEPISPKYILNNLLLSILHIKLNRLFCLCILYI